MAKQGGTIKKIDMNYLVLRFGVVSCHLVITIVITLVKVTCHY